MSTPTFPGGVWFIDFEFHPKGGQEGNLPHPVCLVAVEFYTGRTIRLWQDEMVLLNTAPFPTDASALLVAYYASAEIGCFLSLGWPMPVNILDLFIVFRSLTNGKHTVSGNGLLGAMAYFGLDALAADHKENMRQLILQGGGWSEDDRTAILDYCESDVKALAKLLPAMSDRIDWPRMLLQSQLLNVNYHGRFASIMMAG